MKMIDEETAVLLQVFRENGGKGIETYSVEDAREIYRQARAGYLDPESIERVSERKIDTRDGSQIKLRIYDPRLASDSQPKMPAILFIHGGGWVIGSLETHDAICRLVAKETQYPVISIDYRLAPEYPFPYALHDCLDALDFIVQRHDVLNIDPKNLIMMGDSAGANLATVITHQFNQEDHYQITKEVLFYPVTTMTADHDSYQRFASGYPLSGSTMDWFIEKYLPLEADLKNPQLSPLFYDQFAPNVQSFILTVGLDPLCDEGIEYAQKLITAGNYVEYHHQPDTMHGILTAAKIVSVGKQYILQSCNFIKSY